MSADQITENGTLPGMCRVYHRAGAMCYVWLEMADRAELVQRARELSRRFGNWPGEPKPCGGYLGKPSRPSTTRRSCAARSRSDMEGWGYPSTWRSTWQPSSGELWIHGLVLFYLGQPQLAGRDVP